MKVAYVTFMIALAGVLSSVSICYPEALAKNEFLKGFVTHEILGIMGVIMTISIASIATIHIWFNELEQKHDKKVFGAARREINQAAFIMIWLFVIELGVLIVRSMFTENPIIVSFFNSASVLLLLTTVITLLDILGVIKSLTPED